jgi:hypothetical protein
MLWGQYPALMDGPYEIFVDGMAYVVETEEHQKMLGHYETRAYEVVGVRIWKGNQEGGQLSCGMVVMKIWRRVRGRWRSGRREGRRKWRRTLDLLKIEQGITRGLAKIPSAQSYSNSISPPQSIGSMRQVHKLKYLGALH